MLVAEYASLTVSAMSPKTIVSPSSTTTPYFARSKVIHLFTTYSPRVDWVPSADELSKTPFSTSLNGISRRIVSLTFASVIRVPEVLYFATLIVNTGHSVIVSTETTGILIFERALPAKASLLLEYIQGALAGFEIP